MICRDICPRHLLDDMRLFGENKLQEFSNIFNKETVLKQVYGDGEGLEELHVRLDTLTGIVEIFCQVSTFADDWYKHTLVEQGALEWTLEIMNTLKEMVEKIESVGLYKQFQLKKTEEIVQGPNGTKMLDKHPFAGYNSKMVSLVCSLTYRKEQRVEDFFMSPPGKLRLGMILSYTKMDIDNPMLREWCLVVIRNLCSWSNVIREDLAKLQLIDVDPKGKEALDELGMKQVFEQEVEKQKQRGEDGNLRYQVGNFNFDEVDF